MKKRIMIVGPSGCGKTTLANFLNDENKPLRRTQDLRFGKLTIDAPGAYIENACMYKNLIVTGQNSSRILMLVNQAEPKEIYPPGFAKSFNCPVNGVITKTDLMAENAEKCISQLRRIGIDEPYFMISFTDGTGISELKEYLFEKSQAEEGNNEIYNRN